MPAPGADVNFGGAFDQSYPETDVVLNNLASLRSLWFGAGRWYNLVDDGSGNGALALGTANGWDTLLAVNADWGSGPQSENNIEVPVTLLKSGHIFNESEGGLRIGGALTLSGGNLRIGGYGATHFAGDMTGATHIGVGGSDAFTAHDVQPHFVLSGDNSGWSGNLNIYDGAFAIAKGGLSLGTGATNRVHAGGSFAFRNHISASDWSYMPPPSIYATGPALRISGSGITRAPEAGAIGALYNDGGVSVVSRPIQLVGFATMGARGDREGGLALFGPISGGAASSWLIKVGPGLIVFGANNTYLSNTIIRDGVLRLGQANALPTNSRLVFQDSGTTHGPYGEPWTLGGILELMPESGDFTRTIGTGAGQVYWEGSGGFSASGGDMSVTLNGGTALTWGAGGFVPNDKALLLSSRYASNVISFTNDIDLGSGQREIRVERGANSAYAVMAGTLSGSGGITKTGRGMLYLAYNNKYNGATRIEGGAVTLFDDWNYSNSLPNSNIQFAGGVLGLNAEVYMSYGIGFERNIGSGAGEIQWLGHGGFAVWQGYEHPVRLNGGSALNWGAGGDIDGAYELRFGYYTADGTVMWENAMNATGGGDRTIRLERGRDFSRADIVFNNNAKILGQSITLNIVGDGRMDYKADTILPGASSTINIRGAELRLDKVGAFLNSEYPNVYYLSHGGTLTLDKWWNLGNAGGGQNYFYLTTPIIFKAGNLNIWQNITIQFSPFINVILQSGGNAIDLRQDNASEINSIALTTFVRLDAGNRSTLQLRGEEAELRVDASASGINGGGGTAILPWAISEDSWLTPVNEGGTHYLRSLTAFYTGAESGWSSAANVRINGAYSLGNNRIVNSLSLVGAGDLYTNNGLTLQIYSGGLMNLSAKTIGGTAGITTSRGHPLYIHTPGQLTLGGTVNFFGSMDVVKSGPGSYALTLNSNAIHRIGDLYIHSGTVDLQRGQLNVGRIYVGDGAGTDIFKLPSNRWEAVRGSSGQRGGASITLHGTPYDPRGPDYGGDQAVLMMGGNTKQSLANLHIEERGTIDWVGGEVGKANILWLDTLTFSGTDAILYMRNWYEYEDFLLVKKGGLDLINDLQKVVFEGYENYTTKWRAYDGQYWQITPFDKVPNFNEPEPETYGALLAALGTGLVLWRRHKRKRRAD